MSKVTEALAKLDVNNDNHWTADGLPRIDTVRMIAGNQALTREMITAEMPEFSRQTASLGASVAAPVVPVVPVAPVEQPKEEVAEVSPPVEEPVRDFEAELVVAQQELHDAIAARNEAQRLVDEKQNAMDEVISAQHAYADQTPIEVAVQGYLASQKELLTERGRRSQVLREKGVTLADIQDLIPQKAPIDIALSRKR
jgi:hypothetical protein